MKLRLRLALATIAVVVPTVVALRAIDRHSRRQTTAAALIAMTERQLDAPGEQARCEAAPATWTPPPPGPADRGVLMLLPASGWTAPRPPLPERTPRPTREAIGGPPLLPPAPGVVRLDPRRLEIEFFPLDADLRPARPAGPALPRWVGRELARGEPVALPAWLWDDVVEVVVRAPWRGGPCAHVYVRGRADRGVGSLLPSSWLWLVPIAAVMAAVLVAMGPVVRRIRRLTDAVAASAAAGFAGDVPEEGRDEIAVLARAFAAAGRAIRTQLSATEQRELALRDFLASTTHDVMIPLTVLQAHLATMQEHEQEGRPRDGAILTSAMDEAHYLGALMHNLGAVAKLDAGVREPVMGPVDLNALVHRVVSRHRAIARRLEIALEFAVPDELVAAAGDVTLLEQAVSNVVYNAVRHNRPGGHVAVILEVGGGERFALQVVDDGPGIPADELCQLVDRGFRGNDARTRSPDGQGLGLNIALRVAELHRFTLRFSASEHGGLQVDLEGRREIAAPA
jgi:two-component system sensor histidine kinase BaeS